MTEGLAIEPDELAIVKAILAQHLPEGCRVFVFGSRATGIRLKPWSDLDLVIEGAQPLSMSVTGRLRDAFDESLLAWKVDVVDRRSVSEEFGRIIDESKIALP